MTLEDMMMVITPSKASTTIDDFNEYFDTEFSDAEFDTIGGLF